MAERVGFIGLGAMGKPMAERLLETKVDLVVYDKVSAPVQELVKLGAVAARSPKEVGTASSIVMVIVRDDAQISDVVAGNDGLFSGMRKGGIILLMSTISSSLCHSLAAEGATLGLHVLDAPVSGAPIKARPGTLTILVGGDKAAFERCLPVLRNIGANIHHMGDVGTGESMKLINNMIAFGNVRVALEGLKLARAAGIDRELARKIIAQSTGASWAVEQWNTVVIPSGKTADDKALALKDMHLAKAMADELGVDIPMFDLCLELRERH